MNRSRIHLVLSCAAGAVFFAAACSQSDSIGTHDGANADAGGDSAIATDAAVMQIDAGRPRPPPLEIIPNHGGPIVKAPELVTITWKGDPIAQDLEAFDTWLPSSQFFTTLMAEWGVGAGSHGGTYVVDTPAPATLAETDIATLVTNAANAGLVPAPNGSRIYMIYPPAGTIVTNGGFPGCSGFQAYHSSFQYAGEGGTQLAIYAATPRCADTSGMTPLDFTTWGSSHEVMEASSDPDYENPAWVINLQTAATPQPGENADLCAGHPTKIEGHMVTRNYSNVAAKADQRPCVPAPPGPMFGLYASPAEIVLKPGTTATVSVYAYANGPMDPWQPIVYASDPNLKASLSKKTAMDGDTLTLTVTAAAAFNEADGANVIGLYGVAGTSNITGYQTVRPLVLHSK